MATQTAKLTISLPQDLIEFTDELSNERNVSRSRVISLCLQEFAERRKLDEMKEGYLAMAKEHRQFAETASAIAHEVVPEWE